MNSNSRFSVFRFSILVLLFVSPLIAFEDNQIFSVSRQSSIQPDNDQTNFSAKFESAARKIFEQGLADPRGGEYRELEIKSSNVWGSSGNIKIHGWLIKKKTSKGVKHCVGWNGLIYPVSAIGEKQDLQADVLEMLRADEKMRADYLADRPKSVFSRWDAALPNGSSVQHGLLLPIKAVLLWRLNKKELAEKVWNTWKIGTVFAKDTEKTLDDPYLILAQDWTWALFDRAVTEQMQDNNEIALSDARLLTSVENKIEAEAMAREFKLPDSYNNEKPRYLSFLSPLPVLLKEMERRNTSNYRKNPSLAEIAAIPNADEKIKTLIVKLEDVSARQWGQPGGVDVANEDIIKMLVAQGNRAVEPLLQVIEFDERLTHSVSFHRNFFRGRHFISVAEAAYEAVTKILKTNSFISGNTIYRSGLPSSEARKNIVSEIRAYLQKYGAVNPAERWYNILIDDNAAAEQWRLAAANIIYSYSADDVPPNWIFNATPAQPPDSTAVVIFRGLPLRSKTSPSVSQLFAEKVSILSKREDNNSFYTNLSNATSIAMALLIWDSRSGVPVARSLQKIIEQKFNVTNRYLDSNHISTLRSLHISLYLKRAEAGDNDALEEYAEWISKIKTDEVGENITLLFEPMWRFADHSSMKKLAVRFFETPSSPWLPLIDNTKESFERAKLIKTPMINVESFRQLIIKGLSDKSVIGVLHPRKTSAGDVFDLPAENIYQKILLGSVNSTAGYFQIPENKENIDFPLAPIEIRVCDIYATKLLQIGIPIQFNILWTKNIRDRSISEMVEFIKNNRVKTNYPYSF